MDLTTNPIDQTAKTHFGINYLFPYQRLVVSNILERKDQIVILPTGAGKSLCFYLPAAFFSGPTLILFPLLALMSDQARRLEATGLGVQILRGGQSASERREVFRMCSNGSAKYLISNPETLIQPAVLPNLKDLCISHMVIDEAHTVSEWGESFRPTYLQIPEIKDTACIPQISAFTATASDHILSRLKEIIFAGDQPHLVRAVPDRPNIGYSVLPTLSKDRELRTLVPKIKKPAIIFCRSRTAASLTALNLFRNMPEIPCRFYHAGLSREEKSAIEKWFFSCTDGVLAATCAYGMGVDKGNIRTVIHRDLPPSVEAYLQESGRAGRDREPAQAVLLFGAEDWHVRGTKESPVLDTIAAARYRSMLRYATAGDCCRRSFLLALLSAEPEMCFGCDVCGGTAVFEPTGMHEILSLFSRRPRTFTANTAAWLLSGKVNRDVSTAGGFISEYRGELRGWTPTEVEEAISALAGAGLLRASKRGPWKRKIRLSRLRDHRANLALRNQLLTGR